MYDADVLTWLYQCRAMLEAAEHYRESGGEELGAMMAAVPGERLAELRAYMDTFEGHPRELEGWARERLLLLGRWATFNAFLGAVEDLGEGMGVDMTSTLAALRSFDGARAHAALAPHEPLMSTLALAMALTSGAVVDLGDQDRLAFATSDASRDIIEACKLWLTDAQREGTLEEYFLALRMRDPGPDAGVGEN